MKGKSRVLESVLQMQSMFAVVGRSIAVMAVAELAVRCASSTGQVVLGVHTHNAYVAASILFSFWFLRRQVVSCCFSEYASRKKKVISTTLGSEQANERSTELASRIAGFSRIADFSG